MKLYAAQWQVPVHRAAICIHWHWTRSFGLCQLHVRYIYASRIQSLSSPGFGAKAVARFESAVVGTLARNGEPHFRELEPNW
jgi:hypothetical protein